MADERDRYFRAALNGERRFEFAIPENRTFFGSSREAWESLFVPLTPGGSVPPLPAGFRQLFTPRHGEMIRELIAVAGDGFDLADLASWFILDEMPESAFAFEGSLRSLWEGALFHEVVTSSGGVRKLDCQHIGAGQPYLGPRPNGIDALFAWEEGETGCGARFGLVDEGVDLEHPAVPDGILKIVGNGMNLPDAAQHGTKSLGIVAAAPRDSGEIKGIAHGLASVCFAPVWDKDTGVPEDAWATLEAIYELRLGGDRRAPGGILLVNRFFADRGQKPIEEMGPIFYLLRLAALCGLVVVEPAGNGSEELVWKDDSGAIMVGGAVPSLQGKGKYKVEDYTNHGKRVNCYGWGRCVRTAAAGCRYGDFDGTSAAASMIAGIALVVQGAVYRKGEDPLSSHDMRCLLSASWEKMIVEDRSHGEKRYVPNLKYLLEKNLPDFLARRQGSHEEGALETLRS